MMKKTIISLAIVLLFFVIIFTVFRLLGIDFGSTAKNVFALIEYTAFGAGMAYVFAGLKISPNTAVLRLIILGLVITVAGYIVPIDAYEQNHFIFLIYKFILFFAGVLLYKSIKVNKTEEYQNTLES